MSAQERPAFNVCVFCGSSPGVRSEYRTMARKLGGLLAREEVGLVYGGASVGLMGEVANACLEAGGYVEGVIPDGLFAKEVAHTGLNQLFVVESMHARKALMARQSDAFVAMPGGFGTLEELFEVITWSQLGIHQKPIALFNVAGYYDPLLSFLEKAVTEQFIPAHHRQRVSTFSDPASMLSSFRSPAPVTPTIPWLGSDET